MGPMRNSEHHSERHSEGSASRRANIDSRRFAVPDIGNENELESLSNSDNSSDSSYAGSALQHETEFSAVDYLQDQLNSAFDEMLLDKAVAVQAKTSGVLNAKSKELVNTINEARDRILSFKQEMVLGLKYSALTQKELEVSSRRLANLTRRVRDTYPIEYQQAKEKFPIDEDNEL